MQIFNQTAAPDAETAHTGLVRKDSIEELCGHRARALELYKSLIDTLAAARAAHARACVGKCYPDHIRLEDLQWGRNPDFLIQVREKLDADMWRGFLVNTTLGSLMDVDERKKFEESLKKPPEVTPETVYATLDRLRGESGAIFRRGLVNAFSRLSRDYRSHDGFKIGDRVILEYVAKVDIYNNRVSYVSLQHYAEERLRDIDRVFHVLDAKPAPEHLQGLCAAMREAMRDGSKAWEVTTRYFRVKWFKNGNAHLYFLRDDLVRAANRLIAEHYGMVVGAATDVAEKSHVPSDPPAPATEDFFETPQEIVERMLVHADVAPHHNILEPSAGLGAIAKNFTETVEGRFTAYEASAERHRELVMKFPHAEIGNLDFLQVLPQRIYDRVLMNPPFSNGVDALHVIHALKFVAPGGRLVAIMSAGITFRTTRAALYLKEIIAARGGIIEELPSGSFKESGTNVNTVLVAIDAL